MQERKFLTICTPYHLNVNFRNGSGDLRIQYFTGFQCAVSPDKSSRNAGALLYSTRLVLNW